MFMGLKAKSTEGGMVKMALILEHAGRVETEFMIDPPAVTGDMDHSSMEMGETSN